VVPDLNARALRTWNSRKKTFFTIFSGYGPIFVCIGLILMQPDLGTSVDIVLIATAVLFVAGISWKWIAAGGAPQFQSCFFSS